MFTLDIECPECEFTGEVEAWEDTHRKVWGWTCPKCGFEHEDDSLEPEDGIADYDLDAVDYYDD